MLLLAYAPDHRPTSVKIDSFVDVRSKHEGYGAESSSKTVIFFEVVHAVFALLQIFTDADTGLHGV
jgi:hypothetical protein